MTPSPRRSTKNTPTPTATWTTFRIRYGSFRSGLPSTTPSASGERTPRQPSAVTTGKQPESPSPPGTIPRAGFSGVQMVEEALEVARGRLKRQSVDPCPRPEPEDQDLFDLKLARGVEE